MSNWQDLSATSGRGGGRITTIIASATLAFLFPGVIGTVIGITLSNYSSHLSAITNSDHLIRFIEALSYFPVLSVALLAAYAAAMLSTIDSAALSAAQSITWDITNSSQVEERFVLAPIGRRRWRMTRS